MATTKKQQTPTQAEKEGATQKRTANPKSEKPQEFEEQRSTALRMKPEALKRGTKKAK